MAAWVVSMFVVENKSRGKKVGELAIYVAARGEGHGDMQIRTAREGPDNVPMCPSP